MPITSLVKEDVTEVTIEDEMTIYTSLDQKTVLFQYLKPDIHLQINLSKVSDIDGAGIQILLFLKQESITLKCKLSFIEHSQAIVEVFELLNLGSHFGDPIVISADWGQS